MHYSVGAYIFFTWIFLMVIIGAIADLAKILPCAIQEYFGKLAKYPKRLSGIVHILNKKQEMLHGYPPILDNARDIARVYRDYIYTNNSGKKQLVAFLVSIILFVFSIYAAIIALFQLVVPISFQITLLVLGVFLAYYLWRNTLFKDKPSDLCRMRWIRKHYSQEQIVELVQQSSCICTGKFARYFLVNRFILYSSMVFLPITLVGLFVNIWHLQSSLLYPLVIAAGSFVGSMIFGSLFINITYAAYDRTPPCRYPPLIFMLSEIKRLFPW